MNVYKHMYYSLFGKVSDIIEELAAAQRQTEEMFINEQDTETQEE